MVDQTALTVEANIDQISSAVAAQLIAKGTFEPAKKRAKHTAWETNFAWEYVEKFYKDNPHWYRQRVGELPNGETDPIYIKTMRYADCVVRMPDHILIMEMKMIAKPEAVSQLQDYMDRFKKTSMFQKYKEEPVIGKIVCALCDKQTEEFIKRSGIELEVYKPENYDAWYEKKILKTG